MSILDKIILKKKNRLEIKKALQPLSKLKEDIQFHQKIEAQDLQLLKSIPLGENYSAAMAGGVRVK